MIAYHQPRELDEALGIYAANPLLKVLAGGTDVYPAKATRAGWGDVRHPDVLDISQIEDLRGVTRGHNCWHIGALTTWSDILRAELPPLFDGLKAAAREVGGIQIQNRGTVAGNLCNASPAADGVPPLLTLDAEVEIESAESSRQVPLTALIDGYRHTILKPGELVSGIVVPEQQGRGHFLKLGARRHLVISIAMVAGAFDVDVRGRVRSARIAVGACSPVAQRLPLLEAALIGKPLDPALASPAHLAPLQPVDDVRASAAYRRAAALQLVRDLIARAAASERGAA
jgi:N-methylhydantoinase B